MALVNEETVYLRPGKQRTRIREALRRLLWQPGPDIDRYSFELGWRTAEDHAEALEDD